MKYNNDNLKHHFMLLAWAYADHMDKSTEWMFQYMADYSKSEYDEVVDFVCSLDENERSRWYKENPDWLKEHDKINTDRLNKMK